MGSLAEQCAEINAPFLTSPHHLTMAKTGTIWTAIAHIITALIGAGVLSLAWSIAQLGWIAGPIAVLVFAGVTLIATYLICDCYRSPDPEYGQTINRSYLAAVGHYLGRKSERICAVILKESLFGTGVAYTITAAASVRAIQKSHCYHREGYQASCSYNDSVYILFFGFIQVIMSQIPDFHNMKWLSILATIMSFGYSTIGLGLGSAKVIANREIKGSLGGIAAPSRFKKTSLVFQGIGDVAFSFPYTVVVLEIQDTLKLLPENKTMKKASLISVSIATFFFLFCACFGYAAFGDETPGNILKGFEFYEPSWIVDLANACIVVHLVGGYQVFSQPFFASVEGWFAAKYPNNFFVNNIYSIKLPMMPTLSVNLLRLCFRTTYVAISTSVAILFPFFNQVLGVLGGINFYPLAIYFPVEMYLAQEKLQISKNTRILLRSFSAMCLLVCLVALAGSVEGLLSAKFGKTH